MNSAFVEAFHRCYSSGGFKPATIDAVLDWLAPTSSAAEIRPPGTHIFVPSDRAAAFMPGCPAPATDDELPSADAGGAFAFGYHLPPGAPDLVEMRIPSLKDQATALVIADFSAKHPSVPLLMQFELDRAGSQLNPPIRPQFVSSIKDQGTEAVLFEFLRHLGWTAGLATGKTMVVFGHANHLPRIAMLLGFLGVRPIVPTGLPNFYDDPDEVQPRVRDEVSFLKSDFISTMAFAMRRLHPAEEVK